MRSADLADTTNSTGTVSVSILVPSFNPGAHFEPAIRSALGQMSAHDEILIQDAGQWVLWLNADDILVEGALAAVRAAVRDSPGAAVLTGDHQLLQAAGDVVGTYRGRPIETRTLLRRSTCASFSGSVIIRRDYLESLGGFDEHLHCTMDYSLQFRIAETAPVQQSMPIPIGALRFHDASKSANLWRTFLAESFRLRLHYATSPTDRLLGLAGTVEQLVSFLVFRIRLTPGYRRLRGVLLD
jgi:hypothetical protein